MIIQPVQTNSNTNFTSRCPEIRDAQWACCMVSKYQHISPTNVRRQIVDLAVNNGLLAEGEHIRSLGKLNPTTQKLKKFTGFYNVYMRIIEKISSIRNSWQTCDMSELKVVNKVISQLKDDKYANCGEEAFLAGCIAKINGIENVYTVSLGTLGKKLNHVVCVLNRDGSEFDGNIKPFNTIIIDPWFKKSEFANIMMKDYETFLSNFLRIDKEDKIGFFENSIRPINLSCMESYILRTKYSELAFPYCGRAFMKRE